MFSCLTSSVFQNPPSKFCRFTLDWSAVRHFAPNADRMRNTFSSCVIYSETVLCFKRIHQNYIPDNIYNQSILSYFIILFFYCLPMSISAHCFVAFSDQSSRCPFQWLGCFFYLFWLAVQVFLVFYIYLMQADVGSLPSNSILFIYLH